MPRNVWRWLSVGGQPWPGSVIEQMKVIGPLTDPPPFGGKAEDAFDVVIPSLPGHGVSGVAFKINWRSISELFSVMFQDYLAYTASACADHKTVPRRFNYFIGDEVKVVNSENPFNLGEETS
jgi:hypothetical protein